jgi:hypothetical protein
MVLHARVCGRVGRRPINNESPADAGLFHFSTRHDGHVSLEIPPIWKTVAGHRDSGVS